MWVLEETCPASNVFIRKKQSMKLGKIPQSMPPRAEEILKLRVEICEKEH